MTAGADIQMITATLDISGAVTVGHSITSGVTAGRDITGTITAGDGDLGLIGPIGGIMAGRDISGNITAGGSIGFITAARDIDGNITAGAIFPLPPGEGQGVGGPITPPAVKPGVGNIGNITSGTGPVGGDIGGAITAGGSIGNILAGGTSDEKDLRTSDTPAGLIGSGLEWWLNIDAADDTYTVNKPAGEPSPDGLGSITGTITAGSSLGNVTAYGAISQSVTSGQGMGSIWALGDIAGAIAPGAGALQVDAWGAISGDLTAPGSIIASSFDGVSGGVTSANSSINVKTWGDMSGTLEAPLVVNVWALGVVSGDVTSDDSQAKILCYATVSSTVDTYDGYFVDAYALNGANLTADALGPGVLATSGYEEDQVVAVADITDTKMTVNESGQGSTPVVQGVAPTSANFKVAFQRGWEYVYSGGNITGSTIKAGIGADVVTRGNISGTTIDTSLAGAMPSSWWGGYLGKAGFVQPGWVNIMSKGSCDATVTAYTTLAVSCTSMSGSYSANGAAGIQAWGNASPSQVTAGGSIQMLVHGSLSGQITSQNGALVASTSGDVSATLKGAAVGLNALGSFSGNATSTNGAVDIDAYGDVSGGQIQSAGQVDVTTWGDMSDTIDSGGYASVYAYGDSSGKVTAQGDVAVVTFGDETGDLTADGEGVNVPLNVAVEANGSVGGTIKSPNNVSVVSGTDVDANITADDGDVTITSTGDVETPDILAGGSISVTGTGEVTLENTTAQTGAINAWSGGDLTLEGAAATAIGTFARKTSTVTVELTSPGGSVSVVSLKNATVTVNGDAAGVSITSDGDATISVAGSEDEEGNAGSVKTASVTCSGNLTGSVSATDDIELTAYGSITNLTAATSSPTSQLNVVAGGTPSPPDEPAGGNIDGTLTSGNALSATALGTVQGTYKSGTATGFADGSATIDGKGAVDATVTAGGDANLNSNDSVDGSVNAQGDANVVASQSVGASVAAGGDGNVTAIQGAISDSVRAGNDATAMAARSVANVTADDDATVVAGGDSSGNVTATTGDASVTVLGEFNGATQAGGDADVYAQIVSGTVNAGADASVLSSSDITSKVTAGHDASVAAVGTVSADVTATNDATVFGGTQVNAAVTATSGSADVTSGGSLPKAVKAGLDASVFALGDVSADIQAGRDITLVGWEDVTGDLNAGRSVSAAVYSDLSSQVVAGQDANLLVVGNLSAPVQAGGDANITVGGNETADVTAGGEADVAARGSLSGTITADAGDANVYALGDLTGDVSAGASAAVATWGALADNVTAEQNASAWSGGSMQINITATNGDASADSSNVGKVTLIAGGDGEVSAFDALTANMTTGGNADLFCYNVAQVMIVAGGDATLTTGGWLAGSVKTPNGNIDALSFGEVSGEYDAGEDASVVTAADIATATITGLTAEAVAWAGASGLTLEGTNDAYAFAYGGMGGTVESSAGTAEAFSGGAAVLTLNAATTATFNGLSDAGLQVNSGGDADIFAAGLLSGAITAGQDVYATSYGLFKANVNAARDATVVSVGDMQTSVAVGRDLWALSYGNLDAEPFSAGNNIVFVGAVGDITGSIHAENVIQRIASYGAIDATISADPTSPLPPGEGQGEGGQGQAGSIWLIEAYGDITGNISASSDVGLVRSAHDVTAEISAPSAGTIDKFDPHVMPDPPALPNTSLAGVWAELADEYAGVQAAKADFAAAALADSFALAAARAAAFDGFQVSMGSPQEAQAAMREAVTQLSGSIGQLVAGVNQEFVGAWVSQQTAWSGLTSQIAASQAAFTASLAQLAADADKTEADLVDAAIDNVIVQTGAYWEAGDLRKRILADRNNYLANGRGADFDKVVAQLDSEWWHGTFFVGGFLPVVGDAADWADTILYALEGKWDEAGVNLLFALIPIISRSMFRGAEGAVRAADDLNGVRHTVTTGLGNLAQSGGRMAFKNADDVASTIGNVSRRCPLPIPGLGCFVAGTRVWLPQEQDRLTGKLDVFPYSDGGVAHDGLFWGSVLAGAFLIESQVAERIRRRRHKANRIEHAAAIAFLFGCERAKENGSLTEDDELWQNIRPALMPRTPHDAALADFSLSKRIALFRASRTGGLDLSDRHSASSDGPQTRVTLTHAVLLGRSEEILAADAAADRKERRGALDSRRCAPAHRFSATRRIRSAFLISVCLLLGLVGVLGTRWKPADHAKPARLAIAAAFPSTPHTKPIEQIVDGERVYSALSREEIERHEEEIGLDLWLRVKLRMDVGPREHLDITLRRPIEWVLETEVAPGGSIHLNLPEFAAVGRAHVLAVEPYPDFNPGPGAMVTGTFARTSDETISLEVTGLSEPIRTTPNHPLLSEDRGEYVAAGDLRIGERLRAADGGVARVLSAKRLQGPTTVHNLEVEGEHVYYVSDRGILVHNACVYRYVKNGVTKYVGITGDFARRAAEHMRDRGISIKQIKGLNNLTRYQARSVEQALINHYGLKKLLNEINSISKANKKYKRMVNIGNTLLKKAKYPGF